jgi:hypothetical protein
MKIVLIFLCGSCSRIKGNASNVTTHNHITSSLLPVAVKRNKSNLEEREFDFEGNTILKLIMVSYTDLCYGSN